MKSRGKKIRKNPEKGEDAVSAVVGVMLMLVVTIIIAAVVSAFSSGMISTKDKTQQVTFTASVDETTINFDHMGGDPLSLADLRIDLDQKDRRITITNDTIDRDFGDPGYKSNLTRSGRLFHAVAEGSLPGAA